LEKNEFNIPIQNNQVSICTQTTIKNRTELTRNIVNYADISTSTLQSNATVHVMLIYSMGSSNREFTYNQP